MSEAVPPLPHMPLCRAQENLYLYLHLDLCVLQEGNGT